MRFQIEVLRQAVEFMQTHSAPLDDPFSQCEYPIALKEARDAIEVLQENFEHRITTRTRNAA